MCITVKLETVVIKCDDCKGSGEIMMNDFSEPVVTQHEETCFTCGDEGNIEVVKSITYHCPWCSSNEQVDNAHMITWMDDADRKLIQEKCYIERVCQNCQNEELRRHYDDGSC
jgi:hypothetical protein